MLFPVLGGLLLRCRQVHRLVDVRPSMARITAAALAEAICWGAACWIKPQAAIPALACWSLSIWLVRGVCYRGAWVADLGGLIGGGLLALLPGIAWLQWTGGGPYLVEVFRDWNHEYISISRAAFLGRVETLFCIFRPWGLIHLAAVPLAFGLVLRGRKWRTASSPWPILLAGVYLGWLLQVLAFQQGFTYHFVPLLLLGIPLIAGFDWPIRQYRGLVLTAFAVGAIVKHPMMQAERQALWPRCLVEGSTPELQDRLALVGTKETCYLFDRRDLRRVTDFLRSQEVKPGELTVFDWRAISLYYDLDLPPSTRYTMLSVFLRYYPSKRERIRAEVDASRQAYLVTDLTGVGLDQARATAIGSGGPLTLPPSFPAAMKTKYPWSEPIVFRAGQYVVHRADNRQKIWDRVRQVVYRYPPNR